MFSIYTLEKMDQWTDLVKGFKQHDIYYLPHYTNSFKILGDGEPLLLFYEDKDIKAINVVMKRDIEKDNHFTGKIPPDTYYDLSTPYGYGGFLVEGNINIESLKKLDFEYCSFCKNEGYISEIVRFHPVIKNASNLFELYEIQRLGETITLYLDSKREIWNNLNGNKKRWIKKSINAGVKVYCGRDPNLFNEFKEMYFKTMEKNQAKDYYFFDETFFNSILHDLQYNALIFYALYEEVKIAMVLVLFSNGQIHHHLSTSDLNFQHLAATNLLMYEIACWGSENQFRTFHLGGGVGSRDDNLLKFKEGFNQNSNTHFSIGKKIFDEQKYYNLIDIRKLEEHFSESNLFFPLYRS